MSAWAEWRATTLGIGADRAIVAAGFLNEETYLRAYAAATGIAFEPLSDVLRAACPFEDERLLAAATAGILPLQIAGEVVCVVAPRSLAARQLAQLVHSRPELRHRFRVTSGERLTRFVLTHAEGAWGRHASEALRTTSPALSAAAAGPTLIWRWWPPIIAIAISAGFVAPGATLFAINTGFSLLFFAWTILRLVGALLHHPHQISPPRVRDAALPIYTVIAPIYREATSVAALIASIEQLDWPAEKLDVKIVVEADDIETQAALARLDLGPHFEIIVSPPFGPRTKPKALNAALPFARGSFTVIFDAEDRPEPSQLRSALAVFLANDPQLACVQAALTIDNTADSWLARGIMAQTPQAA